MIPSQAMDEDAVLDVTITTVGVVDGMECDALLVVDPGDDSVLTTEGVTVTGTTPACTLTLTPAANVNGTTTVTVSLSVQGMIVSTRPFGLTVRPVNDAPGLGALADVSTSEDVPHALALAPVDVDGPLACAGTHFGYTSSSTAVVAAAGAVTFSGSWPSCVATITPVANASGTTTLTITLSDGASQVARTLQFSVTPVDDPPAFGPIADTSTDEDTPININFNYADPDSTVSCGSVSASSTNATLLSGLSVSGTAPACVLAVTTRPDQHGTTTITLSADNSDPRAFKLTVNPVNDPPSMNPLGSTSMAEDMQMSWPLVLADNDGPLACTATHLSYTSSNTRVVAATGAVTWSGTWPVCNATIRPVPNGNGNVDLVFTVSDGVASASRTLTLTVIAMDDAPSAPVLATTGILEHSLGNTFIGTVSATDPDGQSVAFSIVGVTHSENPPLTSLEMEPAALQLDPRSGTLLQGALVSFDRERQASMTVTVRASDGFRFTDGALVVPIVNATGDAMESFVSDWYWGHAGLRAPYPDITMGLGYFADQARLIGTGCHASYEQFVNLLGYWASSDDDFVERMYWGALGRGGTAPEISFWVGEVGMRGRAPVMHLILDSVEFSNRCTTAGGSQTPAHSH